MKKEAIYLSLAMLAMATTPYNAHAQEMEDTTLQLKEVTISTTRMPEVKQNAAATVTIIDQKQIAEMSKAAPDITHLLGLLTPGMATIKQYHKLTLTITSWTKCPHLD